MRVETFCENGVGRVVERQGVDFRSFATLVREGEVVGHRVQVSGEVLGAEAVLGSDHYRRDRPGNELNGLMIPRCRREAGRSEHPPNRGRVVSERHEALLGGAVVFGLYNKEPESHGEGQKLEDVVGLVTSVEWAFVWDPDAPGSSSPREAAHTKRT